MSNSLKQSKVLLEGWRKFYLKEAEEPTAKSGNVARIFDFDGTLYLNSQTPISKLASNPFWALFVNAEKRQELLDLCVEEVKKHTNEELFSKFNSSSDIIISLINSSGFDKSPLYYILSMVVKDDAEFINFSKTFMNLNFGTLPASAAVPASRRPVDYDYEDFPEEEDVEPTQSVSGKTITGEEKQALLTKWVEAGLNKSAIKMITPEQKKILFSDPLVKQLINKLKEVYSFSIKKVSFENIKTLKKQIISKGLDISPDKIKIADNIAKSKTGTTSGMLKGTAGKFTYAKEFAEKNKNKQIEVYDNGITSMSQIKYGIENAGNNIEEDRAFSADLEQDEKEQADAAQATNKETAIAALDVRFKKIKDILQKTSNVNFFLVKNGQVKSYNNGPFSRGKDEPSLNPLKTGFEKSLKYERQKDDIVAYIKKKFLGIEKAVSAEYLNIPSKAVFQYLLGHRMPLVASVMKYELGIKKLPDLGEVENVREIMVSADTERAFATLKELAKQSVAMYEQTDAIMKAIETAKQTAVKQEPQTGKQTKKTKTTSQAPIEQPEPAAVDVDSDAEESELPYDEELTDDEKRRLDKELRETILKELKPMLAQLSKIANIKRK